MMRLLATITAPTAGFGLVWPTPRSASRKAARMNLSSSIRCGLDLACGTLNPEVRRRAPARQTELLPQRRPVAPLRGAATRRAREAHPDHARLAADSRSAAKELARGREDDWRSIRGATSCGERIGSWCHS